MLESRSGDVPVLPQRGEGQGRLARLGAVMTLVGEPVGAGVERIEVGAEVDTGTARLRRRLELGRERSGRGGGLSSK